ncbi:hypothetical protein T11_5661 [Trichinella zimbabwensis]|uniref:Uncharacterized protein n=1 Tax=Trichinella zimbabwensis TaxID=268475 RepID=A0A0V1DUR0_9BILA|nr:hypothetical protein T11_5661 [Trichinella zimbabwensis]
MMPLALKKLIPVTICSMVRFCSLLLDLVHLALF